MRSEQISRVEALCRNYLSALEGGDLEALLANFTDDAVAISPISGRQPARDFYTYVMRITSARKTVLRDIFIGVSDPTRAAVHFSYTRTVGSGEPATIEGVDVFELTEDCRRIASVTIIYDTAPVRADFAGPTSDRTG
ncbi:Ketosteroid isomerase homolog [Microbulbifer donghaiensis]|uniref:Ketosteroid isomerase homolog n=1 Tax=Microbulbifer donghaiensis TaxID=494016 RepID=A0A1M5FD90_9GAMM|nr:nuclear transport factor 2 family protein [Microbulbifer donghaiensis]SHF89493.1 Ketosteroid isomerase homolog [Microbulbifer donghaiensis]